MFQKVKYNSLNELIYKEIKEKIIDNELKPNEKLDIDYLSASMRVSRTPVTNALKSLQKDGYVVIHPRSGSYVRELTQKEVEYIFDFRQVLECEIIRKVIGELSQEQLQEFRDKFETLLNISHVENDIQVRELVKSFFVIEIEFHEYLINACPRIIGTEIMNLMDLTKRIRKLHVFHKLKNFGWECFQEEITVHIKLIESLLAKELESSIQWITRDICKTKEEILESYQELH
mgnify:FL=1